MRLLARSTITVDCEQDCPVVAMLRPRSGTAQWVISERYELAPWVPATEYVDGFGNLCQRYTGFLERRGRKNCAEIAEENR